MQTFLPRSSIVATANCLDKQRLGKQRVECLQIANALLQGGAWASHPATRMWRGHTNALLVYGLIICEEWKARRCDDTVFDKLHRLLSNGVRDYLPNEFGYGEYDFSDTGHIVSVSGQPLFSWPSWMGDDRLHSSHRSNLLRKDKFHYEIFGWSEGPELVYYWPC